MTRHMTQPKVSLPKGDELIVAPDREDPTVTPYRDGPILVRGTIKLSDTAGRPIQTHRKTIALCRCGRSSIRPLCDGTHKKFGFTAPGRDGRVDPGCKGEVP